MSQQSRPERPVEPRDPAAARQQAAEGPAASSETATTRQRVEPARERSPWTPRLIAWTVILFLLLLFALQNLDEVEVRVLLWVFDVQLVWALLIFALLGYILGWIRPRFRSRR